MVYTPESATTAQNSFEADMFLPLCHPDIDGFTNDLTPSAWGVANVLMLTFDTPVIRASFTQKVEDYCSAQTALGEAADADIKTGNYNGHVSFTSRVLEKVKAGENPVTVVLNVTIDKRKQHRIEQPLTAAKLLEVIISSFGAGGLELVLRSAKSKNRPGSDWIYEKFGTMILKMVQKRQSANNSDSNQVTSTHLAGWLDDL